MISFISFVTLGVITSRFNMSSVPQGSRSAMVDVLVSATELVMGKENKPTECNKLNSQFSSCIRMQFPVGANYFGLKTHLLKDGFKWAEEDEKNNRFYFIWSANNLANYKVVVLGGFDKNYLITELKVLPHDSL
jgi:hypothetical protein